MLRTAARRKGDATQSFTRLLAVSLLGFASVAALSSQEHAKKKVRTNPDYLSEPERLAAELYRTVLPTVVTIITRGEVPAGEAEPPSQGLGSGVLISPDCHILTAAHVVEGAEHLMVKTHDGAYRAAELIYAEQSADIALLRLKMPSTELPHARLGDSDHLAVGQSVYVIGAPYGLEDSFTVGHISGFREFDRLYDGSILAEFIQTDAALNSGNSGGPVFNSQGEVIGISSRILSLSGGSEGLGFAVAINTAKQLLALEERAWMGLDAVYLPGELLAALFNLDVDGALLIQHVAKGSPADKAGLRAGTIPARIRGQDLLLGGDLIMELGHQEACHAECLVRAAKQLQGSDLIPVEFLRDGKHMMAVIDVSTTRRHFMVTTVPR